MEEAKYSINIKYRQQGYECQLTMRADTGSASAQLILSQQALNWLAEHGAEPTNGRNGKAAEHSKPQAEEKERVCPVCGKDDKLELIDLGEKYQNRQAWKCQRCIKWLPNGK